MATNESKVLPRSVGKDDFDGGLYASVTLTDGRFGRAPACCDHAAAGASTRNRRLFGPLFERHGRGEDRRAGALLRPRKWQGRALSSRRRPGWQTMERDGLH